MVVERLHIFVSSTIKECAEERSVVRDAIRSLNHDPILFEEIGARPHPPREVYTARLEMSQLFVGIYRESYGWIAPDMDISGVEDEFRIASARGMDRLVYVYSSPKQRDPKLQSLIEHAKNAGVTVASYSDPDDLRELVRNDVTAVVSQRFVDQAIASASAPGPSEMLDAILPAASHRQHRLDVEQRVLDAIRGLHRAWVTGPLGSGKTVMLAQLAIDQNWVYVDGQGLSRLELLARTANAVRQRLGEGAATFTNEDAAIQELSRKWSALAAPGVVAVDNPTDPIVLWDLVTDRRRLVVASRHQPDVIAEPAVSLQPLTSEEVRDWVAALQGKQPEPQLTDLVERSAGNPLYLRFYVLGDSATALPLQQLELRAVQSLPARAREITSYLALSSKPLLLGDLAQLIDSGEGPESVAEHLAMARGLLREARGEVQLVHEHLKATVLGHLHQSPTRLAFFGARLGAHFEAGGRYVAAFHVYREVGELRRADRILDPAANQAALFGGGAPAIPIFERRAERAHERGRLGDELEALLSLAYAQRQIGTYDNARVTLDKAKVLAHNCDSDIHLLRVRETEILLEGARTTHAQRLRNLVELQRAYADRGDAFNAARVGTLIAAEHITVGEYIDGERVSRESLQIFSDLGDEYGARVTRLNLAAALSGMPGREAESGALAHELQEELDPAEYPRERALICNMLTRHYRDLGDPARAAEFAIEAIRIGEELQDNHLIATNRMNLGNARRDEGRLDRALEEYCIAEKAALSGGNRRDESFVNELMASVHNEREEYRLAAQHATYAASVARELQDYILTARSEEERAEALRGQREFGDATTAYAEAARAIAKARPEGSFFVSLLRDGLTMCANEERVDLKLRLLGTIFDADGQVQDGHPLRTVYAALLRLAQVVRADRLPATVALLMADMLADTESLIERQIILQSANALISSKPELSPDQMLAAVAGVLLASSGKSLNVADLVELGERLAVAVPTLHFKPHPEGAAHWTVRLEIAGGVIVTITQLDDSSRSATTALLLVALLATADGVIGRALLETETLPRMEAIINVVNRTELEKHIDPSLLKLGELPAGFAVFESTNVTHPDQPPIMVVCADDFGIPWRPNQQALSDLHYLLGELLRVLTNHLLARAVEPEVLFPKIGSLVRRIGFDGAANHGNPRLS